MKICHVITRLILGGAQENTILTCEGQRALGHDVTLITGPAIGPEGELMSRARRGGYRLIVIDSMRREINPLRDWFVRRAIMGHLRTLAPDVVHTHSSKAGILGRQAAWDIRGAVSRNSRILVVHTIHGLPFHRYQKQLANWVYVALERRAARQTDAIISVADAMTRQALAAGVGRSEQYTTVYSGMEVEPFLGRPAAADEFRASLNLPAGAVLVTQVSRLAELKGHEFIIAAAERIKDPLVHFCFVGDGHWRARIERQIAQRGLTGRFHLTGLLDPERIPAVMHTTDILVHCSLREGLARTLPQAMLARRPVVSFDVDGATEVVNERTGVLLQVGDVDGLVSAVETLAKSPPRRDEFGAAGRAMCREKFDHRRMVERIEEVYHKTVAGIR